MISTFSVSITIVGSIFSLAKNRSMTRRVADPTSNSTNGCPASSRGATRRRRASGCPGGVTTSSSSRMTGTVTRSDSSIGSVSSPASTRPGANLLHRLFGGRDGQPDVEMRMDAPQILEERRKDVEADGHAARQAQRAAQLARAVGDDADRFAHILKDALAELHEAFGGRRHPHFSPDAQEQRLAELLLEQQICRLMADCDTWSFLPHAVNEPVSAMACRISSCRKSIRSLYEPTND